jgi:hypothetical protein
MIRAARTGTTLPFSMGLFPAKICLRQAPTILTDIPQIRNENGAIFTFSAQFSAELAPFPRSGGIQERGNRDAKRATTGNESWLM